MIHKSCKKPVYFFTTSLGLASPSILFNIKNVLPGPLELVEIRNSSSCFVCSGCGEHMESKIEVAKNILLQCDLCHKHVEISELSTYKYLPKVCNDCVNKVKKGGKHLSQEIASILSVCPADIFEEGKVTIDLIMSLLN